MSRRLPTLSDDLLARALLRSDRRGGAGLRRGGRGRGSSGKAAAKFDPTKLYALSLGAPGTYATQAAGGEAGVASGFGALYLIVPRTLTATYRRLGGKLGTSDGWTALVSNTSQPQSQARDGAQAQVTPSLSALMGSDLHKVHALLLYHTGAALQAYLDHTSRVASLAITGFTPSATAEQLGQAGNGFGATDLHILGRLTFRGTPSVAQLQTLLDDARTRGDLPISVPGATITHRQSLRDVLATANLAVADGAAAPDTLPDSVTAATVDAMAKTGSPVVRVIDPSVDGRKTYGALGFASTSVLQSAAGAGFRGNLTGFTVRVPVTFWSLSGNEYFLTCGPTTGYRGWLFWRSSAALNISVGTGGATVSSTKTLTASDLGVTHLLHLVYDGIGVEGFFDGVSLGKTTAAIALATAADPVTIGALINVLAAANENIFALAGCNYAATPAEVAADFAAWQRTARLADIPGKPDANRYEITLDVVANGGPQNGIPATVLDRVGADHLTRMGTGMQVAQRAERLWSYEATPILLGAEGWTLADYFEALVNALPGDPAGFTVSLLGKVVSQSVASTTRRLFSQRAATNPGWEFGSITTNSAIQFSLGNTNTISVTSSVAAADVGKLGLYTGVWDATAGVGRLYAKRVQAGTGTVLTGGFAANTGVKPMIGRRSDSSPSDGIAIYGVYYAPGIATLAQYQAQWDACMATERIAACPGLPGVLIDLTADVLANGGALPATLTDRGAGGVNFSRVGAPALSSQYARAWTA